MSEEKPLPKIYTVMPDELRDMHPHGQWVFDVAGCILNFACEVNEDRLPEIEPWAKKLEEFRASDEPYMAFESPHLPGLCYMHRGALDHIVATQPAWSRKVIARHNQDPKRRVQILDHDTGLPVISKLPRN